MCAPALRRCRRHDHAGGPEASILRRWSGRERGTGDALVTRCRHGTEGWRHTRRQREAHTRAGAHGQWAMLARSAVSAPGLGAPLRRRLGLLVVYGLGMMIGAGVDVVIGDVVAHAGAFAVAGVRAGLTAL